MRVLSHISKGRRLVFEHSSNSHMCRAWYLQRGTWWTRSQPSSNNKYLFSREVTHDRHTICGLELPDITSSVQASFLLLYGWPTTSNDTHSHYTHMNTRGFISGESDDMILLRPRKTSYHNQRLNISHIMIMNNGIHVLLPIFCYEKVVCTIQIIHLYRTIKHNIVVRVGILE